MLPPYPDSYMSPPTINAYLVAYLPKTVRFSVILTGGLENFNPHLGGFRKLGIPYLIATGGM